MEIAFPLLHPTRNSRLKLLNSIRKLVSTSSLSLWRTPFMFQDIRSLRNSGTAGGEVLNDTRWDFRLSISSLKQSLIKSFGFGKIYSGYFKWYA